MERDVLTDAAGDLLQFARDLRGAGKFAQKLGVARIGLHRAGAMTEEIADKCHRGERGRIGEANLHVTHRGNRVGSERR